MRIVYLLLLVFLSKGLLAQNVANSTNPPAIQWQSISTEKVKVLFPKGLENEANRIASLTNFIDTNNKSSIGDKNCKIAILLHGKSMFPNGFVTTSPFRSEFFGTPIQDWSVMGANDWLDLLAVHEYRHALQFSNADRGITKVFHIISGQLGWNVASNISIPNWFWEGDATLSETLQTSGGRGRVPSFSEEQRALFEANKNYKYGVLRNGSFIKRLPSHYPLGYTMNLYAREKYGNDVWKNIIADAGAYRRLWYPFNGALKRNIGLNSRKLYKASFADLDYQYEQLLTRTDLIDFEYITPPSKKLVTYYSFPHIAEDGAVLALKSSRKETDHVVRISKSGKEETLFWQGITHNNYVSYGKNNMVWLENQANPRWANEDFSRVMSYDMRTGKKTVLRNQLKAVYAAVDKADQNLLTVQLNEQQVYKLYLEDLAGLNGSTELQNPGNWAIAYPVFDKNGDIYYLAKRNGQISIIKHEISTDKQVMLTPWMTQSISELAVGGEHLFVRAGFSGIDNIYAMPLNGGDFVKITSVKVAALMPAVNLEENKLVFANSTNTGQFLAQELIDLSIGEPFEMKELSEMEIYKSVNSLSENGNILNKAPELNLPVKEYKGFFNDLKIHSWGLASTGFSLEEVGEVEATIEIDDYLEVNRITPTFAYNFNEKTSAQGLNYSYGKFASIINLGFTTRERKVIGPRSRELAFNENEFRAGLSFPLSWLTGNYQWQSNIRTDVKNIRFVEGEDEMEWVNPHTSLLELNGRISSARQRAFQNLQSRFGFELRARMAKSFAGESADLKNAQLAILLPSFARNHGITITAGTQMEDFENGYQLNDTFNYPRGFRVTDNDQVNRLGIDYKLPLLYPDFGLAGITYFKRIRANLFYDFGQLVGGQNTFNTQSTGIELRLDQTALNLIDLPVGVRLGYRIQDPFVALGNPLPKTFVELLIGN